MEVKLLSDWGKYRKDEVVDVKASTALILKGLKVIKILDGPPKDKMIKRNKVRIK